MYRDGLAVLMHTIPPSRRSSYETKTSMRASFETSDAPCERVVSSAMHAVQWHCQRSDVEAELSRAKARQKWHKQRPPLSSVIGPMRFQSGLRCCYWYLQHRK